VDISYFLKFNDISITDRLIPGAYYFVKKKNARASTRRHTASSGESLWSISQEYGVQLRKLRKYNSRLPAGPLREGMVVLLTKNQKVNHPIDASQPIVEVSKSDEFNWSIRPEEIESTTQLEVILPQDDEFVGVPMATKDEPVRQDLSSEVRIPEKKDTHIVSTGETLYSISKRYGVSVMDLVNWNGLKLAEGIKPGQTLQVTDTLASAESTSTGSPKESVSKSSSIEIIHEVRSSETLYSVARKYGVTIKDLMEWNNKSDFALSPGEKLRIIQKP
jgi:membrane-bound lytic murein transglycosylase D